MTRSPPPWTLSEEGRATLAEREGLRLKAYHDSRGILTIGLGHTSAAGAPEVFEGMTIAEDEAWEIFRRDTRRFADEVRPHVAPSVELEPHEFDALVSFVFNIGPSGFIGSTCLKRLNAGDHDGAAEAMLMWMKPPELKSRRYGEYWQFRDGRAYPRADKAGKKVK